MKFENADWMWTLGSNYDYLRISYLLLLSESAVVEDKRVVLAPLKTLAIKRNVTYPNWTARHLVALENLELIEVHYKLDLLPSDWDEFVAAHEKAILILPRPKWVQENIEIVEKISSCVGFRNRRAAQSRAFWEENFKILCDQIIGRLNSPKLRLSNEEMR